ncbi:MAG TPA: sugar ABC transporter ATP-binding protein [Terriglobales bacterium]|nr:sugar ABC transporter ATP-binding protein [Terriglobales bacterium]
MPAGAGSIEESRSESPRSSDLVLSDLSKAFGGVVALRDASLHARSGEVHGLIGENGAGKSTLVKILAGAITADHGEILYRGSEVTLGTTAAARSLGVATAFQELSLVPDWDVATNLLYRDEPSIKAGRVNPHASRRAAAAAMKQFGVVGIDPGRRVSELRLAERQMLEIMHALMAEPNILILDEPTSALTPEQVWWFFEQVRAFVTSDRLVLFISHRLEEIESLCDRVTVLRDGRNVGSGPISEMPERRLIELVAGEAVEQALAQGIDQPEGSADTPILAKLDGFASPPDFQGIDLEVRQGEIVGVAGLEGQGQLELFLALYGARKSTGQAFLGGKRLRLGSPAAAIAQGVGLVPHDRGLALCLSLSIRDNLTLGSLRAISRFGLIIREKESRIVHRAMTALRVRARGARTIVETLSGGNQQKVLLGRVLALQPKLLLLYDATRGVDVGTKAEIFNLIREQARAGVAILFYSTDVTELIAMCHRVVVLHDGSVRAELSGIAVTEQNIIAAAIGGRSHG